MQGYKEWDFSCQRHNTLVIILDAAVGLLAIVGTCVQGSQAYSARKKWQGIVVAIAIVVCQSVIERLLCHVTAW